MDDLRAGDCRFWRSAVCVFGMARGCIDQPHCPVAVIYDVADAAAAGHLVLPLLHIAAVVPMGGQVTAEPVLTVMPCSRPRVGAEGFQASPGVRQGVAAQFLPSVGGVAGAEPDIPLILRWRDGDPVPATRAHPRAWTGPKSP